MVAKLEKCPACGKMKYLTGYGKCNSCYVSGRPRKAGKGYHNDIHHPQLFLVGEAGPEYVDITPLRRKGIWDVSDYLQGF